MCDVALPLLLTRSLTLSPSPPDIYNTGACLLAGIHDTLVGPDSLAAASAAAAKAREAAATAATTTAAAAAAATHTITSISLAVAGKLV
jgi:hypothetical protein